MIQTTYCGEQVITRTAVSDSAYKYALVRS